MLKVQSLVLAALLSVGLVASASANELKIGFVNTQRIFRDAPAAVKAAKKMDADFSKRDQDLQRMTKQVQALQEKLEKDALTMSESERRIKEREFGEQSRELQRKQRESVSYTHLDVYKRQVLPARLG